MFHEKITKLRQHRLFLTLLRNPVFELIGPAQIEIEEDRIDEYRAGTVSANDKATKPTQ